MKKGSPSEDGNVQNPLYRERNSDYNTPKLMTGKSTSAGTRQREMPWLEAFCVCIRKTAPERPENRHGDTVNIRNEVAAENAASRVEPRELASLALQLAVQGIFPCTEK